MVTDEFSILIKMFKTGDFESSELAIPPYARLADALGSSLPSHKREIAILLRHALVFRSAETGQTVEIGVPTGEGWPDESDYTACSLKMVASKSEALVSALNWKPDWLLASDGGVGFAASSGEVRRPPFQLQNPGNVSDPILGELDLQQYRSHGQRVAVRSALRTPAGSTLAICLPTGEGKSTVFHAISVSTFVGEISNGRGTTIVVTPTVSLAIDHERRMLSDHGISHKTAYIGGLPDSAVAEFLLRIADGSQRIIFTSPEALCGKLRNPIIDAARFGLVRALVIDEAHMVDAWGASFRPEFQMLSGLRRQIMSAQTEESALRTILLSATFSADSLSLMSDLFSDSPSGFDVMSAAALRPEIEYWSSQQSSQSERVDRVMEGIMNLPRPAILYTTLVDDADSWAANLKSMGFQRISLMTGDTSAEERSVINQDWIEGRLDLVVATSAFGLGVDNPTVRSVIHACIPESIDRFYQEVGRGGRDGKSSVSLIVPAFGDENAAGGISDPKLITSDLAFERWSSMWKSKKKQTLASDIFRIAVDVPPGTGDQRIDMKGSKNTTWHRRTLNTMAAAGLIELLGSDFTPVSTASTDSRDTSEDQIPISFEHYQTIRILDTQHLLESHFKKIFNNYRISLKSRAKDSLAMMMRLTEGSACSADLLIPTYTVGPGGSLPEVKVQDACGGCSNCRVNHRKPRASAAVPGPEPWQDSSGLNLRITQLANRGPNILMSYTSSDFESRSTRRRFLAVISDLVRGGVTNMLFDPEFPLPLSAIWESVKPAPLFVESSVVPDMLPPGPLLILGSSDPSFARYFVGARHGRSLVIGAFSEDARDPRVRNASLRSRFTGPSMSFNQLNMAVTS